MLSGGAACVLARGPSRCTAGSNVLVSGGKRDASTEMETNKVLTMDNLNPNIIRLQYAVRGPLVIRAGEIEKELEKGAKKPFKRVIKANIGDAHAMGQVPITFFRQVLACVSFPDLIKEGTFPEDVKQRAKSLLQACSGGSMGAYTASHGIEMVRRSVAEYISNRDGHPSRWQDVCLSAGASIAIKNVLQLFCRREGAPSGVMVPIPQYPLYSATLAEYGLQQTGYYLDEDNAWGMDVNELQSAVDGARSKGVDVRAIVVINPGNPTGQVLSRDNIESVIKFAHKNKLFILADEVYQDNVYEGLEFVSFKKVLCEIGAPYDKTELASFMSTSKGYMGECGIRGGYMELVNMDPEVQAQLFKCISAMLCPTTYGQVLMDLVTCPPRQGEPSYELFMREKQNVLKTLAERALMIVDTFNKMPGFKCNVVQGAMYAFPNVTLPQKAIEQAKAEGKEPDVFYAFKLLEETGICVVPGSGFGQRPGTYHFRTTILPQTPMLRDMLNIFKVFHDKFTKEYS